MEITIHNPSRELIDALAGGDEVELLVRFVPTATDYEMRSEEVSSWYSAETERVHMGTELRVRGVPIGEVFVIDSTAMPHKGDAT